MNTWKNWRCEIDGEQIARVTLDRDGEKTNTLSRAVVSEFKEVIEYLEQHSPKGVILRSGKPSGFIFGADIHEFLGLQTESDAFELIHTTQNLLTRWEALPMPTVAIIRGMCLGGGLEVALSCRYRVADTDGETMLGLPEVRLGIQPGWGGTVRLPRVVGIAAAMPLILTGQLLDPKRAKRLGFVDVAQPKRHCETAALALIAENKPQKRARFWARLPSVEPFRSVLSLMMKKEVRSKGIRAEHYPAPYAIIDAWRKNGLSDQAFRGEAQSIARLMVTKTAKQLVRVFFMQSQLKATAGGGSFSGKRVHVIGAGTMGGDIAAWCALQGFHVTLQDQSAERISPAMARAEKLYLKKLRDPRLVRLAMDRLQPDVPGSGVSKADLIIEAVFENLQVKQELFCEIEKSAKPTALFATNTSSIPLSEIAGALSNPERLVGIHFFNPVSQMQLVEVVHDSMTSEETKLQALRFVKDLKRFPLPVKSSPGFLVNRVLVPYLLEATALFDEGVDVQTIDEAALAYGMPMGPIRLADTVGLDVCFSVAKNLLPIYGGEVPVILAKLVEQGQLGVKTKRGFYNYADQSAKVFVKPEKSLKLPKKDIMDRLIYRQLNEAVAALREGIVESADLLDAGMIYGTGFAPFRGGPLQAARDVGITQVIERFKELEDRYGARFAPDSGWKELNSR
jgi:3-hydroxyacyl-CoA dehydrogenase/enoyl-CoA hydratase/3-hydroxybutyryl-CoA epimerase